MEDYSDLAVASSEDYSDLAKPQTSEGFLQKVISSIKTPIQQGMENIGTSIPQNMLQPMKKLGEGLGDVYAPATEFVNQMGLGYVKPGIKELTGLDLPEASSLGGKLLQGMGGIAGYGAGAGGRLASVAEKGISKILPGTLGILPRAIARTGVGAGLGAAQQADTPLQRTMQTGIGAILNPLNPVISGGVNKFFSSKPFIQEKINLPSKTAQEVGSLEEALSKNVRNIESEYGTSPYIKGEGKIGQEVKLRQDLAEKQREIQQKFSSDLALRREAVQNLSQKRTENLKNLRMDIQKSANELAYTGKEEANKALKSKLKDFHDIYDEKLGEIGHESITRLELAERLKNASSNMGLGARKVLTGDEQTLKGLAEEIHPAKQKGESISKYLARGDAKLKAEDIKAFMKNIRSRMNPTDHPLTEVYKEVGDLISEKMPGYSALKEEYKPIYETIKNTKKLFGEGAIRSYTTPTVSRTKLEQAKLLEKELGIEITGKAKDISSKRLEVSKQFGLKSSDLREIKDKKLNEIYTKLSSSKENQNKLIHEMRNKIEDLKIKHSKQIQGIKGWEESRKNFLQNEIDKRTWRKAIAGAIVSTLVGGKGIQSLLKKGSDEY